MWGRVILWAAIVVLVAGNVASSNLGFLHGPESGFAKIADVVKLPWQLLWLTPPLEVLRQPH
jgi:hypothetical protein